MSHSLDKAKGKRRIMKDFEIEELSGVDSPAQRPARILLAKAEGAEPVLKRKRLLREVEGHTHLIDDAEDGGYTSYERAEGAEYGHTHPWVRHDDGTVEIGAALGHTHKVIAKSGSDRDDLDSDDPSVTKMGAHTGTTQETTAMTTEIDTLKAELAKAQATIATLSLVAALPAVHKAHHDTLPEAERAAFAALPTAARDEAIRKAAEADAPTYTAKDGTVVRKSQDPHGHLAKALREADEAKERLAKAERAAEDATFAKRAVTELAGYPGEDGPKVALLRAIEKGEAVPEEHREGVKAILAAGQAILAKAGVRVGTGETQPGGAEVPASAKETYDAALADFAKAEKIDDLAAAEVKFVKTAEGRKAYNKAHAAN